MKLFVGSHPIIAVVGTGSEATILAQELFNKLATNNIEMLHIPITGAILISVWSNCTKKTETQAVVPFEMIGGYFEHTFIIADCILGADFLDKFQVNISFEDECMHTKDENGSRWHHFVSEEMSEAELKEEAPIRQVRKFTVEEGEKGSGCNSERKKERNLGVLASEIAYYNHKFPLRNCDVDSVEKSRGYLQHTTICASPNTVAVDTRVGQDSELLRKVGEASRLSIEQETKLFDVLLRRKIFTSKPSRCNLFQYEFKVTPEEPLVGHSQSIPCAVRSALRAQIKQMLKDKIIEPSDSSYLNPLTIVLREG